MLSMQQVELNSPIGYDDDLAESFASTTSSCGNTNYPFTSPTPYALNATAATATPTTTGTAVPTATATCTDTYTVMNGDTCQSVAIAHNVSSFYLAYNNNLDIYCSDLTMGRTVCIPEICDVYTVQPNDTCTSIIRTVPQDITVTQLQSWNPNINLLCGNMDNLNGTVICVR
jgi:LysM repeat protein